MAATTQTAQRNATHAHPPAVLLHYCILLTGFGTVFLGPMLPALVTLLHLSDRGAGTLLAAQFTGAFCGGWTTVAPLRTSMLRGLSAATVGFAALATQALLAPSLLYALPALCLLGFGVGQTITSVNLIASAKWAHRRGAALNLLNFSWSLGAFTAPLLVLRLLHVVRASTLLYSFAALLLVGLLLSLPTRPGTVDGSGETTPVERSAGLPRNAYLFFGMLLFLYGGVETSLGGWLATFDQRYGGHAGWEGMAASTTAFWASLTVTRLLTPLLLRAVAERVLLRTGLALGIAAMLLMLAAQGTVQICLCAGLAGVALSPWFPLVLSVLVARNPTASQAGRIIAVSGLGAAALPWLVGQLSHASGSLRIGLLLPVGGIALLLALSFATPFAGRSEQAKSV